MSDAPQGFDAMKSRLDEIVDEVSAEGISLDEALAAARLFAAGFAETVLA